MQTVKLACNGDFLVFVPENSRYKMGIVPLFEGKDFWNIVVIFKTKTLTLKLHIMKAFTNLLSPLLFGTVLVIITSSYILYSSTNKNPYKKKNQKVDVNVKSTNERIVLSPDLDTQISFTVFQADTAAFRGFQQSLGVQSFTKAEGYSISGLKNYLNLLSQSGEDSVYVYFGDNIHSTSQLSGRQFSAIFWKKPGAPVVPDGGGGTGPYD